jgi:predicted RNA-binding Zn-ribbon protein involved in translation (DUF1610 family)
MSFCYYIFVYLMKCFYDFSYQREREDPPRSGGRDESDPVGLASHVAYYRISGSHKEEERMKTVRVYRLDHLSPKLFSRLKAAQMAAAQVWNVCVDIHKLARIGHVTWPNQNDLHLANKGRFALHSQSVQAVFRAFLGTIETTSTLRRKHSHRWKKLQRAKNTACRRSERRVRDLRHKATRQVIDFCVEQQVGTLFIGNPHGVRNRESGRHHNQRMSLWEYGRDIDYLTHTSKQVHILSFTGSERGTSSRCPVCGHKQKPKGRNWACRACGFHGHRDLVGSINMHQDVFGIHLKFPCSFTYQRAFLNQEL